MIKVNLLATNPGAAQLPREWFPREQRSALVGLGMLVVCALGVGGWWFYQHSLAGSIQTRITAAEAELTRLQEAAKLVDELGARRAELSERLSLIERLRAGKRAPVTLLETVSRSVPEGLWLLEIKQSGAAIQVDGRALSLTAVTDFAARLQESGLFRHPVEILTTVTEVVDETTVVRFSVKAEALPPTDVPLPGQPPAATSAEAAAQPANTGA
jgi:type IV pilus assembly protein PilN